MIRRHQHEHRRAGAALRARAGGDRVLKWLQVTITGTRFGDVGQA